jgi:heptosyltransferase-2
MKKKILILQTAFLGDVILALPVVQTLKNLMPDCIIDFLCIPVTANALENHPDINKIIKFDKKGKDKLGKLIEVISTVKKEHYDIVLCPHRSFRSALITYYSKAPVRIGFDRNSMSFLLSGKVIYDKEAHEIQRGLDLIGAIPGVEADDSKVSSKAKLNPSEHDFKLVDALLEKADKSKLITLAPCSKWYTKQLIKEKAEEIIRVLFSKGHEVLLIGGAEDFKYCKELEKDISDSRLFNLCGRLSPLQSYAAISRSKALITVDSAAQHLGSASDVPITLIYGSTDRSFGFFPLEAKSVIIENKNLDCRPCTDHGRTKCPLGHFKCIADLDAQAIVSETENLMNQ